MDTQIKDIPLEQLKPHPDNPRLFLREDVIDGIAAQLQEAGYFDPAHALLVRPQNGHFQIVRGHHRWKAAEKAGLGTIPCWVREMSNEEAYMQLALGNVQGELSPLEIGVHALKAIELIEGGRGIKGGISAYARQLGMEGNRANLSSYRNAAIVLQHAKNLFNIKQVLNKAAHLATIHGVEQKELWPLLTQWIITPEDEEKKQPSVSKTQDLVKVIKKYEIPEEWQAIFLPLQDIVKTFIETGAPVPDTVTDLVNKARAIQELIATQSELDAERFPYTIDEFYDWLRGGIGTYSWDPKALDEYRFQVVEAAREAQRPPEPNAEQGEWYKLGRHILYCGDTGAQAFWERLPQTAFAFADPPYNAGVDDWDKGFEWQHDWLIEKAPIVAVTPGIESIQNFYKEQTHMPHAWAISAWIKNGMTRGKLGYGNWIYVGIFSQPDTNLNRKAQDHLEVNIKTSETKNSDHKGRKPPELMQKLIELFTDQGDTVIDPFLGSGTTLFEADKLGRACIGGEIRTEFCNEIITRWQDETGQAAEKIRGE